MTWIKDAALPSCILSVPAPLLATVPPKLPAPLKLSRERAREESFVPNISVAFPLVLPMETGVVEAILLSKATLSVP